MIERIPYLFKSKLHLNAITRQFVKSDEEDVLCDNFMLDPLEEKKFAITPHLLHKYYGRVLLITTDECAMHCRFCFRRHMIITKKEDFKEEIKYILNNKEVSEVILSGGDPLMMDKKTIFKLLKALNRISHLKKIRFHTRAPMGIKNIITHQLVDFLKTLDKQIIFVLHINHTDEISKGAIENIEKLNDFLVFSQTVLLKGVNDNSTTLCKLFESLIQHKIIPYYLHNLDKVSGAAHFYVEKEKGLQIYKEVRQLLSGYCVPRYVEELSGDTSKTLIF